MSRKLKVLTLNCWGVPVALACQKRKERMPEIGAAVAKSDYDIVTLQEVWDKSDFNLMKELICKTLPYSHYYYSGTIGSGLCLFSKYPISETLYHRFDPNGYPHKIQHGDWFGGKGVGMAVIEVQGITVHVYVTHLHAEYKRSDDEYLAHRVSQSVSMSQFIKFTSRGADVTLLCGDLNLEPVDLGYHIIRNNAKLGDAWIDKKSSSTTDKDGYTSGCMANTFSKHENIKRIDYILYKAGQGSVVDIEECNVTMGVIPGKGFSFSDHEGVDAVISVQQKTPTGEPDTAQDLAGNLDTALDIVTRGLAKAKTNANFFKVFAVVSLLAAYFVSVIHIPYPLDYFVTVWQVVFVLAMGFGIVHTFITIRGEVHGLETAREDIKNLLTSTQALNEQKD